MVKQIVRDIFFLGQPSEPATKADIQVGKDLQDTLRANRERCVGMAANMIGVKKNIIIVNMGFIDVVMFNPVIVSKRDMYETEEGCLSLDGVRKTTRYQEIEVEYYDFNWKKQRQKLERFDVKLGELLDELREDDLLIITADHGNDPTHTGTDHTREKVPFFAYSPSMEGYGKLEDQNTFAVIGATIADNFEVKMPEGTIGSSLLDELK